MDDTVGGSSFYAFYGETVRNNYNLAQEKSVAYADQPNGAVVSYIYALPVGRGKWIGSTGARKPTRRSADRRCRGHFLQRRIANGNQRKPEPTASRYGGGQHAAWWSAIPRSQATSRRTRAAPGLPNSGTSRTRTIPARLKRRLPALSATHRATSQTCAHHPIDDSRHLTFEVDKHHRFPAHLAIPRGVLQRFQPCQPRPSDEYNAWHRERWFDRLC